MLPCQASRKYWTYRTDAWMVSPIVFVDIIGNIASHNSCYSPLLVRFVYLYNLFLRNVRVLILWSRTLKHSESFSLLLKNIRVFSAISFTQIYFSNTLKPRWDIRLSKKSYYLQVQPLIDTGRDFIIGCPSVACNLKCICVSK